MDIANVATRQYVDVTPGDLLRPQHDDDTTVERVVRAVPSVDRTADVREGARLLVESGSTLAPVVEGGETWGVVTTDGILDAVTENLAALAVLKTLRRGQAKTISRVTEVLETLDDEGE